MRTPRSLGALLAPLLVLSDICICDGVSNTTMMIHAHDPERAIALMCLRCQRFQMLHYSHLHIGPAALMAASHGAVLPSAIWYSYYNHVHKYNMCQVKPDIQLDVDIVESVSYPVRMKVSRRVCSQPAGKDM